MPAERPTCDYIHHYDYYVGRYIDECSYPCMCRTPQHAQGTHARMRARTWACMRRQVLTISPDTASGVPVVRMRKLSKVVVGQ